MHWIIDIVWYFQEPITIFNFRIISGLVAYSLFYCCFRSPGKCRVWHHKNTSKRRIAKRSGKGNQPLNFKTAVERPILKLGLPNIRFSFYFISLLVACLFIRRIFMTSHMTLSSASCFMIDYDCWVIWTLVMPVTIWLSNDYIRQISFMTFVFKSILCLLPIDISLLV